MTAYEKLTKCYECVKSKIDFEPKVALVLGSGLGDYANSIDVKYTLSYKDIEGFPTSTVAVSYTHLTLPTNREV